MTTQRGFLIALEGPDCVGKTTIGKRLQDENPENIVYVKCPDRSTHTGQLIDAFLKKEICFSTNPIDNEQIAQRLFAANKIEQRAFILNALDSGKTVVLDRYVYSGVVYNITAIEKISPDDMYPSNYHQTREFIEALHKDMPIPDCVIVFEADATACAARRADYGTERNDTVEFQTHVARLFRHLYREEAYFLNADGTLEATFQKVSAFVRGVTGMQPPSLYYY